MEGYNGRSAFDHWLEIQSFLSYQNLTNKKIVALKKISTSKSFLVLIIFMKI